MKKASRSRSVYYQTSKMIQNIVLKDFRFWFSERLRVILFWMVLQSWAILLLMFSHVLFSIKMIIRCVIHTVGIVITPLITIPSVYDLICIPIIEHLCVVLLCFQRLWNSMPVLLRSIIKNQWVSLQGASVSNLDFLYQSLVSPKLSVPDLILLGTI